MTCYAYIQEEWDHHRFFCIKRAVCSRLKPAEGSNYFTLNEEDVEKVFFDGTTIRLRSEFINK